MDIQIPSDWQHLLLPSAAVAHMPLISGIFANLSLRTPAIGGGFVRDYVLGRPHRDIDIMVEDEPTRFDLNILERHLGLTEQFTLMFENGDGSYTLTNDTRVSELYGVWKAGQYDILHVSDIVDRVNDFPDSTSKILLTPQGIFAHPEFIHAHEHKVLTYRAAAGRKRFDHLCAKFPAYTTVIHGEFPPMSVDLEVNHG